MIILRALVLRLLVAVPAHAQGLSRLQKPLDRHLQEADLPTVLRGIAREIGANLILHPAVPGSVTLDADQVPAWKVLQAGLHPRGLEFGLRDGLLVVAPPRSCKARTSERPPGGGDRLRG